MRQIVEGDKVRIKSREYFIEKYGTHDSIILFPSGLEEVKEKLCNTVQTVNLVTANFNIRIYNPQISKYDLTFRVEDVDPVPQRSVKELR